MYMYSYYLDKGVDLDKLINLDYYEKQFYIASMSVRRDEEKEKMTL